MSFFKGKIVLSRCLKKSLLLLSFASLTLISQSSIAISQLPDIGTAGISAMTIEQEMQYGAAFMRLARANLPMVDDPVLNEYINDLGTRLVSQADNVRFPFTFFLVKDNSINAAAFLGGKVKVHTGLFLYADNESELAGVLAHEISHVTQRHIARYMEDQSKTTPLSIAGLVGSIALAIVNPTVGMAAMSATMGMTMQSAINFTRENEYEADRIGINLMANAGFNPSGMATFFEKLAAENRYATTVPEMLMSHPVTEKRIAEARNRANNWKKKPVVSSDDFYLAKARIQTLYSNESAESVLTRVNQNLPKLQPGSQEWYAAEYAKALALMKQNHHDEAAKLIQLLIAKKPNELFFQDSFTDLQIDMKQYQEAIQRLKPFIEIMPNNPVVVFNLANAYLKSNQPDAAIQILDPFSRNNEESTIVWQLLAEAYQQKNDLPGYYQAQAEYLALLGNYDQAMDHLRMARANTADTLNQARIDAIVAVWESQKKLDMSLRR